MSKTIKFTISDEQYNELHQLAQGKGLSDQEYIRTQLFQGQAIFTPQDAVKRALTNYSAGETFTVPELYGTAWTLPNGTAGQFGQAFDKLVAMYYSSQIESLKNQGIKRDGRVVYKRL